MVRRKGRLGRCKGLDRRQFRPTSPTIDHLRYFAGCVRAQEGSISEIDPDTIAYHFHEPLGVVNVVNGFGREAGMPLAP